MPFWKKLSPAKIKAKVFAALDQNVNFYESNILGVPGSHLDQKVFYQDYPFLRDAPFLTALIRNPNHIGCHTLSSSESFFSGTQELERELIRICAEDILRGERAGFDGYVAAGGTEANMQAIWIYRNLFQQDYQAKSSEITILCSADSHYSMSKAANVFGLDLISVPVDQGGRKVDPEALEEMVSKAKDQGKRFFIVIANMMTTMFGSVDDPQLYIGALEKANLEFRLHIYGAYGGFFYPFSHRDNPLDFANPKVSSVTLDAHKMVQAPYGTGIFLIRKGLIAYANTREASYVEGEDNTLIGSRSGANAIAVWMILMTYGPYAWKEKILILLNRTRWLVEQLEEKKIIYYHHPHSNIVTIRSEFLTAEIAHEFGLVPDDHHHPQWYKVVIMEHVSIEKLLPLVHRL